MRLITNKSQDKKIDSWERPHFVAKNRKTEMWIEPLFVRVGLLILRLKKEITMK